MRCACLAALLPTLLAACATTLPQGGIQVRQLRQFPSPNFDERRANLVVLHHTSNDNIERPLRTLTDPARKVSAHYLIARDGEIVQLVDESRRAWHAGLSWWGGVADVNSLSIGIELDNTGNEPFAEPQIEALLALLTDIRQRHPIPSANFVGHADVAPGRKTDPSIHFPWKRLAEAGFGVWCDPPYPPAPDGSSLALLLTALGYNPSAPEAAQAAFRLHFVQDRPVSEAEETALAYCLLGKKAKLPAP